MKVSGGNGGAETLMCRWLNQSAIFPKSRDCWKFQVTATIHFTRIQSLVFQTLGSAAIDYSGFDCTGFVKEGNRGLGNRK